MPVVITNRGSIDKTRPDDWCNYDLSVDGITLVSFVHKRTDGLATCLRRAALAFSSKAGPVRELEKSCQSPER